LKRGKFQVVLLDEYQDTSFNQIQIPYQIFMAIIILSWQLVILIRPFVVGAVLALKLSDTFSQSFNSKALRFNLLTTRRNDQAVLDLANVVLDQISPKKQIEKLKARPNSKVGEVICAVYETQAQEGQEIASYLAQKMV
jgi:DNA helicase-2/ATP-dependent DNA helicase PcrA